MDKEKKVLVIPRYLVFLKFIDVPSLEDPEIEKMAEYQALKEIPHPKEEIVISYRNLSSFKNGFSSLMLAVAGKDMIQKRIQGLHRSGAKVESIRIRSELLYLYLLKKGIIASDKVSFIVYIGVEDSEVMIISRGRIVFSRGFKNNEKFFDEVDRSAMAYQRQKDNDAIDNVIVIYPSDVDMKDVREHIKSHFSAPVIFHECSEDLRESSFSAKIDLLPKEVSYRKTKLQKRQESIVTYSLFGVFIVLFFAFFSFKMYEKKQFIDILSVKIDDAQSQVQGLDIYLKKTDVVKKHIERGQFIVELLERSYILIPSDIAISGLDYNGKDSVFYKGTSKGTQEVFALVKKLEGLKYFSKVEVKHATKKKVRGKEFTDFNIQCQLNI